MARKGRPRKSGARQPNGKLKAPTLQQLKDRDAEDYRQTMQQVASQPHRRGFRDPLSPRLENELGRLCERLGLRSELYDAGCEWADVLRRWRSAKGVPDPDHTGGMGSGLGPTDQTVDKWKRDLAGIESALAMEGRQVWTATRQICIDGNPLGADQEHAAVIGLQAVAEELGRLSRKAHPYVGRAA